MSDVDALDDVTAVEAAPDGSAIGGPPARDVGFFDFRDGATEVAVTHGPIDRSRVCLSLRTSTTVVAISMEEGVARQIASGLADVLPNFRAVRFRDP